MSDEQSNQGPGEKPELPEKKTKGTWGGARAGAGAKPGTSGGVREGAGAPAGNQNPYRGRLVRNAILAALRKRSRSDRLEALEDIADKQIEKAKSGDTHSFREIADRIDGKAPQAITGDPLNPLAIRDVSQMTDEELAALAAGTFSGDAPPPEEDA